MTARLYVIPGSHPATTAALMLDYKGIPYDRTDLIPVVSKAALRAVGFPRATVPALKIEGERVQGSREISRALDRIKPDPPLFPADPERRAAVEDAERFGDEELQHPIRQLLWWCFKHERDNMRSYSEGARLGVPVGLAVKTGGPLVALAARFNEAGAGVQRDRRRRGHPGEHRLGLEEVGHHPVLADQLLVRTTRPVLGRRRQEVQQRLVVHDAEEVVVVRGGLVRRVLAERLEDLVHPLGHLGARRRHADPHLVPRDVSLGGG